MDKTQNTAYPFADSITALLQTIKALRHPRTGCPWDREQTLTSLLKPLSNETAEFQEALEENDHEHIAEELGDIIWNALMLLEVCEEEEIATKTEVLRQVNEKMICRHPHVFAGEAAASKEEALKVYARAKEEHRRKQKNA